MSSKRRGKKPITTTVRVTGERKGAREIRRLKWNSANREGFETSKLSGFSTAMLKPKRVTYTTSLPLSFSLQE